LQFLSRLEDDDRQWDIVEKVWPRFLKRLAALPDAPELNDFATNATELSPALDPLTDSGLVEAREREEVKVLRIHPAVAETVRVAADAKVLDAVDHELGDFWIAMFRHGIETEMQGGGRLIVPSAQHAVPYLMRRGRWEEASTLLEPMLHRDKSPATLAMALPLLRRIAAATEGTERELISRGELAKTLQKAGRYEESEQMLRDVIGKNVAQENYRLASACAGDLLNLLMERGRLEEALSVAEQKADYTKRAGLGPWTQLIDEAMRLQILNALGNYREVLKNVDALREQLITLPEKSEAEEAVNVWHAREGLLDTGRSAAMRAEEWEMALSLNAEIVRFQKTRGADEVEIARTLFNDCGPLLRLRRYDEARTLLEMCRKVFEQAHYLVGLGSVFSALAGLEDKQGHYATAVQFEQSALRYHYQVGQPADCAMDHNNLANYLGRSGAEPEVVLAHRLAAAVIRFQISSGLLPTTINNLVISPLPAAPPRFSEVVAQVEQIEGVRFAELFVQLPTRAPDGDAAIAAVWELVQQEKARREAEPSGPDMDRVLQQFDGLLRGIAAVARGNDEPRAELENLLPGLEENGWQISEAVQRIWDGERDVEALTAGLDLNSTRLVQRILELIDQPSPQEVAASLPSEVRAALEAGGIEALRTALATLPEEEALEIIERLRAAGVIG